MATRLDIANSVMDDFVRFEAGHMIYFIAVQHWIRSLIDIPEGTKTAEVSPAVVAALDIQMQVKHVPETIMLRLNQLDPSYEKYRRHFASVQAHIDQTNKIKPPMTKQMLYHVYWVARWIRLTNMGASHAMDSIVEKEGGPDSSYAPKLFAEMLRLGFHPEGNPDGPWTVDVSDTTLRADPVDRQSGCPA